jgi:hypothetical protein
MTSHSETWDANPFKTSKRSGSSSLESLPGEATEVFNGMVLTHIWDILDFTKELFSSILSMGTFAELRRSLISTKTTLTVDYPYSTGSGTSYCCVLLPKKEFYELVFVLLLLIPAEVCFRTFFFLAAACRARVVQFEMTPHCD